MMTDTDSHADKSAVVAQAMGKIGEPIDHELAEAKAALDYAKEFAAGQEERLALQNEGLLAMELRAQAAEERAARLAEALKPCILALEPLSMDNGLGAKWMIPELRQAVQDAVTSLRSAVADPDTAALLRRREAEHTLADHCTCPCPSCREGRELLFAALDAETGEADGGNV